LILGYQQLVVCGNTLGVLGMDHVQQLLIDLLLLLLQPHIDIHLPQREVVTGYAGADGQPHPSQQGIGLLGRRLARLDATAYLAPQVRLPTGGQSSADAVFDPA